MNQVTLKRISTEEALISQRTIAYQIWVNDEYLITCTDVNDAMDFKAKREWQSHDWVTVN
jgi:hypothetical protein